MKGVGTASNSPRASLWLLKESRSQSRSKDSTTASCSEEPAAVGDASSASAKDKQVGKLRPLKLQRLEASCFEELVIPDAGGTLFSMHGVGYESPRSPFQNAQENGLRKMNSLRVSRGSLAAASSPNTPRSSDRPLSRTASNRGNSLRREIQSRVATKSKLAEDPIVT
mmetsp:Transcript_14987/g.40194  ORF Transcript_14987/g.40194 Transcript_14987/m.40194 type:complete len:168 (+) Transcript_14987:62-565(+)|eukprot:CAMPEP_0185833860 /NCGR_PEP_ID=MMETSP1353-20130828/3610_1 /TAXON_ID=1077150 /ORGANISM="Erythrolobus australicus, Strain CCMP3124" /LENGTH=167 /DNA_ID=CAMNT_0028532195 /DNA_START=80 /DNA_END=583 /DNA_ORIENTATION=-